MHTIILIILMHTIGDNLLQTDSMRVKKLADLTFLLYHSLIYGLVVFIFSFFILEIDTMAGVIAYTSINFFMHLITDYFASMEKAKYWKNSESKYFTIVSVDQACHAITLIITYYIFCLH